MKTTPLKITFAKKAGSLLGQKNETISMALLIAMMAGISYGCAKETIEGKGRPQENSLLAIQESLKTEQKVNQAVLVYAEQRMLEATAKLPGQDTVSNTSKIEKLRADLPRLQDEAVIALMHSNYLPGKNFTLLAKKNERPIACTQQ